MDIYHIYSDYLIWMDPQKLKQYLLKGNLILTRNHQKENNITLP